MVNQLGHRKQLHSQVSVCLSLSSLQYIIIIIGVALCWRTSFTGCSAIAF